MTGSDQDADRGRRRVGARGHVDGEFQGVRRRACLRSEAVDQHETDVVGERPEAVVLVHDATCRDGCLREGVARGKRDAVQPECSGDRRLEHAVLDLRIAAVVVTIVSIVRR